MNKPFAYITDCVPAKGEDIREMVDHPQQRDITRETFLMHVDYSTVMKQIEESCSYSVTNNGDGGLRMASDYYVTYSRSFYKGVPCYYFTWSAIEFIFVDIDDLDDHGCPIPRPKLSKCGHCGYTVAKPKKAGKMFPKNDEDEYQTIYVCKNCGYQVFIDKLIVRRFRID